MIVLPTRKTKVHNYTSISLFRFHRVITKSFLLIFNKKKQLKIKPKNNLNNRFLQIKLKLNFHIKALKYLLFVSN